MRRLLLAAAVLATGCGKDPWSEPGLANPGSLRLQLAADPGAEIQTASAILTELRPMPCGNHQTRTIVRALVSLETTAPYLVEGGWWCGVEADFEPPLHVEALVGGEPVTAELEVPSLAIPLRPSMFVDSHPFILQLAVDGWLSDTLGGVGGVTIGPGDPEHDALVELFENESALWLDVGSDGVLGSDELDRGPVATGPDREP